MTAKKEVAPRGSVSTSEELAQIVEQLSPLLVGDLYLFRQPLEDVARLLRREDAGTVEERARIETSDFVATYRNDRETRDRVFEKVVSFFREHETFAGEAIMQSDAPQIEAPEMLADLADDVLDFRVRWHDEEEGDE